MTDDLQAALNAVPEPDKKPTPLGGQPFRAWLVDEIEYLKRIIASERGIGRLRGYETALLEYDRRRHD